jgi:hypothetical protein
VSLNDRAAPTELSAIEKELLYNRENAGFVKPAGEGSPLFYLDPSPFLWTEKPGIYCCEGIHAPPKGELVEVSVGRTRKEKMIGSIGSLSREVRYVDDWKLVDPATLFARGPTLPPSEYIAYFTGSLPGNDEIIDRMGLSAALSSVSSPAVPGRTGGVNTAFVGRDPAWLQFRRLMRVIPGEFTRAKSRIFYRISGKECPPVHLESNEINLAFRNPQATYMHLPLSFKASERTAPSPPGDDVREMAPRIRPYLLDALLLSPELPERLCRSIVEGVYEINEELCSRPLIPCRFDIDALIPRLGRSFARLQAEAQVTAGMIRSSLSLFRDNLADAVDAAPSPLLLSEAYRLSIHAWKLYLALTDRFGTDTFIPASEVHDDPLLTGASYRTALRDLRVAGYLIRPKYDRYLLLDLGNAYKNGF